MLMVDSLIEELRGNRRRKLCTSGTSAMTIDYTASTPVRLQRQFTTARNDVGDDHKLYTIQSKAIEILLQNVTEVTPRRAPVIM